MKGRSGRHGIFRIEDDFYETDGKQKKNKKNQQKGIIAAVDEIDRKASVYPVYRHQLNINRWADRTKNKADNERHYNHELYKKFRRFEPNLRAAERELATYSRKNRSKDYMTNVLASKAPAIMKELRDIRREQGTNYKNERKMKKRIKEVEVALPSMEQNVNLLVAERRKDDKELEKLRSKIPLLVKQIDDLSKGQAKLDIDEQVKKRLNTKRHEQELEDHRRYLKERHEEQARLRKYQNEYLMVLRERKNAQLAWDRKQVTQPKPQANPCPLM